MAGPGLFDPQVARHLIHDEGEVIIDEVRKHWIVLVVPGLVALVAVFFFLAMPFTGRGWWLAMIVGLVLGGWAVYRSLHEHMDRFVITNMRVFRVYGLFARHTATMPMSRILDISVDKPVLGRILGYGHFVFESAAQDQGLRDIRYVGHPDERDLTIQRVIQRSGLRSSMRPVPVRSEDGPGDEHASEDDGDGT